MTEQIAIEANQLESLHLEQVMVRHQEKPIQSLCKQLDKSCSLTRQRDVERLCELAYRLYISGDLAGVWDIYCLSDVAIPDRINYHHWNWLLHIWGLQARIFQQKGKASEAAAIVKKMKQVYSVPRKGQTAAEAWTFFQKIASRTTYEAVCGQEKIAQAVAKGDKRSEQAYRLAALYGMISQGSTGLYPQLEEKRDLLEREIEEIRARLRSEEEV